MAASTDVDTVTSRDVWVALIHGLGWLFHTEQPDTGIVTHHGVSIPVPSANRTLQFVPVGARGRPVVVVNVATPVWRHTGVWSTLTNPLDPGELPELAMMIEVAGFALDGTWNGTGSTGSVGLVPPAHDTLIAAVNRYRAGCPQHPKKSVFCQCGWYQAGNRLIVPPRQLQPQQQAGEGTGGDV